jgi:hypothetical protein
LEKFSPLDYFNLYKQKKISRAEFIKKLLMVCEYSDSKQVRLECLEVINSESRNDQKIFNTFEEIALTDNDSEIRLNAIKYIIQNFPNQSEKGLTIIKYLIENSRSLEFVMNLSKVMGESIFSIRKELNEKYSEILKHIIIEIFEREDIKSFEIIWGEWFNETPPGFWGFMSELHNPIGILEILDYFLNYYDIYNWFFKNILSCYNIEQWIGFFNNPKFSGRMLYLLIYLAEEENPHRLFQIVEVFEELGKSITDSLSKKILDLLKKNNLYDFTILIIFRWLESLKILNLKFLLEDRKFNLISNLAEVVKNNRFGFIKNDYFLYSLIAFLIKIHRNINERYIFKFFNEIPLKLRNQMVVRLHNLFNSSRKENLLYFEKLPKKYDEISSEVLELLSRYADIEKIS